MKHRRMLPASLLGLAAIALAGSAGAVDVPGDHLLCYKVKAAKFPAQIIPKPPRALIPLEDQFELRTYDAAKLVSVCNPATKTYNGVFAPTHPDIHYVGYQIKLTKTSPAQKEAIDKKAPHSIVNQFGNLSVAVLKADSVLVQSLEADNGPITKCKPPDAAGVCAALGQVCDPVGKICIASPLPTLGTAPVPATSGTDNYKCYKIKDNKAPAFAPLQATVADQFGSAVYDIKKVTKLCTPVDKDGEGTVAGFGGVHLTCYQAKLAKLVPAQAKFAAHKVLTKNLNVGEAWLDVKGVSELCVPSCKDNPNCALAPPTSFDFTTGAPDLVTCVSGHTYDATVGGNVLRDLHCGGLILGGGPSTVAEGATPEGATTRFAITGCVGSVCTLGPVSSPGAGFDCSDTGCTFGPPLPISNAGTSTCVINTFSGPGGGTADLSDGTSSANVPLASSVFLTGNAVAPCPRCVAGTCDRGPDAGMSCTTNNAFGTTQDCQPDGTNLGDIAVDLTPLGTGLASKSDPGGLFCPGQGTPTNPATGSKAGCFGNPACRRIENLGIPFGPLSVGVPANGRLASVFCIPETPGALGTLINLAAGLPGPGSTSLPGTVVVNP